MDGGVVFLGMGIFNIILGFVIKKMQLADMIIGYKPKIHDKEKICDIIGQHFIFMGMIMLLLTFIYYVTRMNEDIYFYTQIGTVIILVAKMYFNINRDAKKNN